MRRKPLRRLQSLSLIRQPVILTRNAHHSKEKDSPKAVFFFCGAAGRTRTGTLLRAADFESATSANFVTAANCVYFIAFLRKICNNIRIGRLERRQICFPISKYEYNTINLTNNQGFFTKNYKLWIKLF